MDPLFHYEKINGLVIPNRLVRSATWEGLANEKGSVTQPLIDLYSALAKGGAGLLVTGHSYVHPDGKHSPRQLGSDSDDLLPGLTALADAVHDQKGRICLQLSYGGGYLSKSRVRQMPPEMINGVAAAFGRAALRARKAGFDAIQILAAHGFFLSQLLCPRYNPRRDEYGGPLENRVRALLHVVEAIRNRVGKDYPILVKLNSSDLIEEGLRLEESIRVGQMLEAAGADALEISGGLLNQPNLLNKQEDSGDREAYFEKAAREFRKNISLPLILVGGIRSYKTAHRLVHEGTVDFVALCRPLIREPDLVNRWAAGDYRNAFCISCNNCVELLKAGKGLQCQPVEPEKSQTFFVQKTAVFPAGPPFPEDVSYEASWGIEEWKGNYLPVTRVQMRAGKTPIGSGISFPGTVKDWQRIIQLIDNLIKS
jgi:2,4-dienoyl-CoA reductase-like NADH-dependent reductase (Old Yellow Enzyme family)